MKLTDADHGITSADTLADWAENALSVTVWPEHDAAGARWNWEMREEGPTEDDSFAVDGGIADTREDAESAGETAKESYIRDLIRK